MPKKKIEEIASKSKRPKVASPKLKVAPSGPRPVSARAPAPLNQPPLVTVPDLTQDLSQFPAAFENKAGHYELIRVDGGQAFYSFTNLQKKTVDATMSVVTWRKMQERAGAAFKETA